MAFTTKKCLMCAEQVPSDAVLCPYCGTRFGEEIQTAPPLAEPIPPVSSATPQSPVKARHPGFWIAGSAVLIIICGAIGALIWSQRADLTGLPGLFATTTPTAIPTLPPTFTFITIVTPTPTPRPTVTATPIPAWVTNFAQPILDAISDRPPSFQDDFGSGSAGWQADGWCGRRMEYVGGELVVTDCRVSRPNINYSDFVIEFDGRFFTGAASDSDWWFHCRENGGQGHGIGLTYSGDLMLEINGGGTYLFTRAANPGNQSNHFLVIGKSSRIAVFLNSQPLFDGNPPDAKFGDFGFFADGTILAIDNLKIWNIANIMIP